MGIRGLTTFIQNRSHLYLEDYELHGGSIVIDGNAIACQLYKWHCKSNDCFGGDYDKYAAVIEHFFQVLAYCNITPYVVFDGGYENRKITTVINRMKNKIKCAQQLNSVTEGSISVFPLFLRETFQDIVLKLNIKCVRCDFEGDTETANIARTLNCPVLSYDSDFFIFDVLYIPFSTFEICTRTRKKQDSNESYCYISCKVYRVEKFLKSFGGLDKSILPILAVLLGNDYVKRSVFSKFYKHLKIQKCHGNQNDQQKRIKSVIIWLQNESIESAIQKILSRYKCRTRKLIADKIQNALKGYNCTDSMYLSYLEITPVKPKEILEIAIDDSYLNNIDIDNPQDSENDASESDSSEGEISANDDVDFNFETDDLKLNIPEIFHEKFRRCIFPPSFMDIVIQNKYYCIPQVENGSLEYSHIVSEEILGAIQKILKHSDDNLVCTVRSINCNIKRKVLSHCDIDMPSLHQILNSDVTLRKNIFFQVLKIDNTFVDNCLNLFPQTWHLFILTIKYLIDKSVISWPIVYALVVCKLFLDYVDKQVGMCRTKKGFEKKLSSFPVATGNNENIKNFVTVVEALENINYNDSLFCLKNLFSYFNMDVKMKYNHRLYDRNIVHSMAQFQSCLLHIKYLNTLLNSPFHNFIASEIFNGTLVYNLSINFMKRSNLDNYITILLKDSNVILNSFKLIIEKIRENSNDIPGSGRHKKRKKKKTAKKIDVTEIKDLSSEEDTILDPNNKFSLLTISAKDC